MAAYQRLLVQSLSNGVDEGVVALTRVLCELSDQLGQMELSAQYGKQALVCMQVRRQADPKRLLQQTVRNTK